MLMCYVPQDFVRDLQVFMDTPIPVNVMRLGHSYNPLVGLIIYHGFVLETLTRSQANLRKLEGV